MSEKPDKLPANPQPVIAREQICRCDTDYPGWMCLKCWKAFQQGFGPTPPQGKD